MRVLYSLLVLLCAIDWYRPDGSQLNNGGFVYTEFQAAVVADIQLSEYPGYTYRIRCEER